jgi:uncharacterized protein (TIGR00266 family)
MASEAVWYYALGTQHVGPMCLEDLVTETRGNPQTLVYGPGLTVWTPAIQVPEVAAFLQQPADGPRPVELPVPPLSADVIDYEVFGDEMQYAVITLDPGEMAIAEPGAMMFMTAGIKMETVFGDPSAQQSQGFWGKVASAGKRLLTGESLFVTTFTNIASVGREQVAFAAPYPGKILPMDLGKMGGELICQKDSFLCAARGVQISVAFQKKMMTGLFGGEGFIMQRLTGDGLALVHAGGTLTRRTLKDGESLRVDTGCLVALAPSINYDVQFIGGFKNLLFGGEGMFFATVTGPGDVWLQSLPFSRLAGRILANAPSAGKGKSKGEGSALGSFGDMLNGDNS